MPLQHGPVTTANISYTSSFTCIIPDVIVHSDKVTVLIALLGHCDLYFTVH